MSAIATEPTPYADGKVLYLTVAVAFLPDGEYAGSGCVDAEPGAHLTAELVDLIRRSSYFGVMAAAQGRLIGRAAIVADPDSPITATPEQGDPQ
jgi:hypothetical protein